MRQIARHGFGRDLYIRRDYRPEVEVHGSEYGGWGVLCGSLSADSTVLSFGIGQDVSFDLSLISAFGLTVHGFDPTPASVVWVKREVDDPKFRFWAYGISNEDGVCEFFLPSNDHNVSASMLPHEVSKPLPVEVEMRSLKTICLDLSLSRIDYMKIDNEGVEYQVISSLQDIPHALLPRQLGVEFHHFFSNFNHRDTLDAIKLLKLLGYKTAWTSATTHEVLFILQEPEL